MKKSLISIIVPVYNVESYLAKCLNSLVNQTLQNIEIIVVNDGSNDNSQKIIDKYALQYPQIKSYQKENGGLSDARNFGLRQVNGSYIAFVDSDDWIELTMMQEMYDLALKNSAEIVVCGLVKVNEVGNRFRELPQSPQLPEKINLEKDFTIFGEMSCFACNKIFKQELFEGHSFKKGLHFEDIELIPQLFLKSRIIAKTDKLFYNYFERQDSISKTHTSKGLDVFTAIDSVTLAFQKSKYFKNSKNLLDFQILQGYFSYLAYVAYVSDEDLKKVMLEKLNSKMDEYGISKKDILFYKRYERNYILSLPRKKQLYYVISLFSKSLLLRIN